MNKSSAASEEKSVSPNEKERVEPLLTNASGMGGLDGGGGYYAQDRYIVCRAVTWQHQPGFSALWIEGMGDVDVLYENLPQPYGEHVQVKNHNVTNAKFKEVVEGFIQWDSRRKDFYRKYILACPSLSDDVNKLRRALGRLRSVPQSLTQIGAVDAEQEALGELIKGLGLEEHQEFILAKLHFDISSFLKEDDDFCCNHFAVNLLGQPKFARRFVEAARSAYEPLLRQVRNAKSKQITQAEIAVIFDGVLRSDAELEPAVFLVINNWTNEAHDVDEGAIVLDWSAHFDRSQRLVPDAAKWNQDLLPELLAAKKAIQQKPEPRLIRFRGFCALSTGIMVGACFPKVNGWTLEMSQPPGLWRTDAPIRSGYQLQTRELDAQDGFTATADSDDLLVTIAVTQSNNPNIARWIGKGSPDVPQFAAAIEVQPFGGAGSTSIGDASDAASFALAVRDFIKQENAQRGTCRVHLFYNGPFALSVMLGHHLTSIGRLHLYEWREPGFSPSVSLST